MEQRTRRRLWWSIAGAVVVVAGVAGGVFLWLKSDQARPIDVDQVVADFRAAEGLTSIAATTAGSTTSEPSASVDDTATTPAAGTITTPTTTTSTTTEPRSVPTGVYLYATTGDERVDALGGDEHRYPSATTITVTARGDSCVTTRWDALEQRWEDAHYCPQGGGGWALSALTTYHSFFHQSDEREFTCAPGSMQLPAEPSAGATFTASCTSPGTSESGASTEDITATVIGFEQVEVGGQQVDTVHIRYVTTIGGESTGQDTSDQWYAVETPLLLVREERAGQTASQTPVGAVRYEEQYTLMLQNVEPIS
jgi:hypothetical protein